MKKHDFLQIISTYVIPSLEIALGVILVLNPDSGSALISSLAGWLLLAIACVTGANALSSMGQLRTSRFLRAGAALVAGLWLLSQPLMLVSILGQLLALALMYWGGTRIYQVYRTRKSGVAEPWPVFSCIVAGLGLILLVSPLSASRLVFRAVGLVVAGMGISELLRRLNGKGRLEEGNDPNIIDAL